ncbi:MAG: 2-hydroxyacyl-CoA dehydratase, partial [Clostridia bacterium]|nr:2-hydroxyacyl-CoA dehydratase [Clostridia bacterium]
LATEAELRAFSYSSQSVNCRGCTSKCSVNILTFSDGRKFISGNKCERGAGLKVPENRPDIYAYKYERLLAMPSGKAGTRGRVGLPLQLVMYEQLPLWTAFFETCGFEVVLSEKSSRELYFKGQHTVASDTACYPAKLMHGHIESLLDKGVDFIFYPCESYNLKQEGAVNYYNCPVVAYYPELLKANNERLNSNNFIMPYLNLNNEKKAVEALKAAFKKYKLPASLIKRGLREGMKALDKYHKDVVAEGKRILEQAERDNLSVVVLAGRPYHADPEINHGINKLLASLGCAVLSEDAVFEDADFVKVDVLDQWTYHARLYRAAEYCSKHKNANLVQLVSFGCGIDAITTDEVRKILEKNGKLYTQIKIDEINNLGVVKIRLRSMLAAIEEQKVK